MEKDEVIFLKYRGRFSSGPGDWKRRYFILDGMSENDARTSIKDAMEDTYGEFGDGGHYRGCDIEKFNPTEEDFKMWDDNLKSSVKSLRNEINILKRARQERQ